MLVSVNVNVSPELADASVTGVPSTVIFAPLVLIPNPPFVALMLIVGIRVLVPVSGVLADSIGGIVSVISMVAVA